MGKISRALLMLSAIGLAHPLVLPTARAELRPDKVFVADGKKTKFYIRDGLVTGGDRAIDEVVVKDIRRAANLGYERIVVDLAGNQGGEVSPIPRAPYYQIAVSPDEHRLVFSLWGNPKLGFDSKKVLAAFKKSKTVENIELLPRVEENLWTFALELKQNRPMAVEVFELSKPVRIILDIRDNGAKKGT